MIAFTGVVPAILATPDEDAAVMPGCGLRDLDVNAIIMQGNFAGYSNSETTLNPSFPGSMMSSTTTSKVSFFRRSFSVADSPSATTSAA